MSRPLRWGMIGGGEGAFIGAVHRMAARVDGRYQLILPLIMLAAYIGLLLYFRGKGGYKPVVLDLKQ